VCNEETSVAGINRKWGGAGKKSNTSEELKGENSEGGLTKLISPTAEAHKIPNTKDSWKLSPSGRVKKKMVDPGGNHKKGTRQQIVVVEQKLVSFINSNIRVAAEAPFGKLRPGKVCRIQRPQRDRGDGI